MKHLDEAARPLARAIVRWPALIVLVALALSAAGLHFARQLRVDTDFANLIPRDYPSVQALERLEETVGGENSLDVIIESPSFEASRRFAEALLPRALALRPEGGEPYFTRAEYRKDTDFLESNALYFATPEELDRLETYLGDQIEQAKLEANPFYFELEEEDEAEEDSLAQAEAAELRAMYDRVVAKEYPVSADSTVLVPRLYPSGAQTDLGFIEDAYTGLGALVAELNPASFHPEMKVQLGGRVQRQLVEVRAVTSDVTRSFLSGVATMLLLVVAYFYYKAYHARAGRRFSAWLALTGLLRTPFLALLIALPLVMSLSWTFGLAYLQFGTLNLMTATLGLVLFGMGIDYGIHFYARYTEERALGRSVREAIEETVHNSGVAIFMTAMSTAAAFFVLTIADFRGFSEFGFIAGTGIVFAFVSMAIVLPALIVLMERGRLLQLETSRAPGAIRIRREGRRYPAARALTVLSVTFVVAAFAMLPRLGFEYDFGALEPKFEQYDQLRDKVGRVHSTGGRRNPAYILVDDAAEVPAVVAALRAHAAADTLTPTIKSVESLQERFPTTPAAQQERLARIAGIRALLDDPFIRAQESAELDRLRKSAQTTAPIPIEQVPEFLQKQFTSKNGEIGNFVMVYPSVGLSNGLLSMEFAEDVGRVVTAEGRSYYAGSTSLVAADMLRLMQKEAPWMVLFTLVLIVALKLATFRSIKWTLLALTPLLVGFLWMIGLMELFGLKLNFYNLVVLPAVLGIGDDSGVHLVHRYQEEGFGSIRRVLRSTGEHITMCSLTTMIGFGGLLLSYHPGLRSIGELAVIGISSTLLSSMIFLPAMIQWLEDRDLLPGRPAPVPGAPAAFERAMGDGGVLTMK